MPSAAVADTTGPVTPKPSYAGDVFAWAVTQARLLRERRFDAVDIDVVAEEIESLGRSEKSELRRRIQTLLEHLYKLEASSAEAPRGNWRETIRRSRREITRLLEDSPSLRREVPTILMAEQEGTATFTAELLEDAGESPTKIAERVRSGGFTTDQVFGSWFPGEAPGR